MRFNGYCCKNVWVKLRITRRVDMRAEEEF